MQSCCQAAAKEVSSCKQETLHGFCRPLEGVWSSASEGHLVGTEKTWCGGVHCATGPGDVCQCLQPCLVLVRGTVKSLKWRSVFTKARYSAHCSSSLCLKSCHASSTLRFPGRFSMLMTLLSLQNLSRNVPGGSWLEKKQWRRVNARLRS